MEDRVKVFLHIEQDDDGYPGIGSESVWALPGPMEGFFTLDNIPFFATDANIGDVVSVDAREGVLWLRHVARETPCSLMRIVLFFADEKDRIARDLLNLGCQIECWADRKLIAASVPNSAVPNVQVFLGGEAAKGVLDYEEPILRFGD
ncbi:DUF4265 domain-containing protein [Luteibacter pinisoli]|uniref:DUF4265 domain-containing protein n=1 Tax=Luteibacter pinisoli TaxID=2589080 RepID=A0A4Y5YZ75_9GAMM|nr:DUF4265 domain-containing protein [Luteibacter pinisoli]QDE37745.1 DUF4265 domain-containing protein [Luteibacter pinisoli]